ncbi:MAG: hypothetical protein ACE5HT_15325 [Gemmatimonadales bacterium]
MSEGQYFGMDSLPSAEFLSVAAGPEGQIYVVVVGHPAIHVFGSGRGYVRRIGREGRGPGEFRSAPQIGFVGDTLWALDESSRRASFFTSDGELIRTASFAQINTSAEAHSIETTGPVAILSDGHVLLRQEPPMVALAGIATVNKKLKLLRALFSVECAVATARLPNDFRLVLRRPWSFSDLLSVSSNGVHIAVLSRPRVGDDGEGQYTVARFDSGGRPVFRRTFTYEANRLRTEEVNVYIDSKVEDVVSAAPLPRGRVREALRDAIDFPKYRPGVPAGGGDPIHGDMLVATDGLIWIGRDTRGSQRLWQILDGYGRLQAVLRIPEKIHVVEATSSAVWGASADSLGVPRLVRLEVGRQK